MAQPRDAHGHFISTHPKTSNPDASGNRLVDIIKKNTDVSKTTDDNTLIDVHIGNPLRRITQLLEEIKKQKAFSFTLKGSLGIMGVVLTLSLLGLFGTTHALCDKGIQTQIGRVKVLQVTDAQPDTLVTKMVDAVTYFNHLFFGSVQTSPRYRYILETPDHKVIHLERGRDVTLSESKNQAVYATGLYDSCSMNLKITDPMGIEMYQ